MSQTDSSRRPDIDQQQMCAGQAGSDVITESSTVSRHFQLSIASQLMTEFFLQFLVDVPSLEAPLAQRRPRRQNRKLPFRFRVPLPQPLPPVVLPADPDPPVTPEPTPPPAIPTSPIRSLTQKRFTTRRNIFGLFRKYFSPEPPSHDPEGFISLQDLSEVHLQRDEEPHHTDVPSGSLTVPAFYPYPNESAFQLGDWYWTGVQKSQESFNRLIKIISSPAFRPEDVRSVSWNKINTALASDPKSDSGIEWLDEVAGWKRTPIKISVPFNRRAKSRGPQEYLAGELFHRSLTSILREKLSNPEHAEGFHYEPFELFWQPGDSSTQTRLHGELYTSRSFARAHQELLATEMEPGCSLPRAIAAMMFWSDATHLTSFGNAKLWPCYLFFGNETKYRRCKPSCHLCSHVAYFQAVCEPFIMRGYCNSPFMQLPDSFKDFASDHIGAKTINQNLMTHCRRELLHAQWDIILDEEFIQAYRHGIIVKCCDGIIRRIYPRIFTYSADYPEK